MMEENLSSGFVNNKCIDQPAHLRRLISPFVIHFKESIHSLSCYTSSFVFHLAEETDLCLALSDIPEDRFCRIDSHKHVAERPRIFCLLCLL